MASSGIYELQVHGFLNAVPVMNRFFYEVSGETDNNLSTADKLVNGWSAGGAPIDSYILALPNFYTCTLLSCKGLNWDGRTPTSSVVLDGGGVAGARTGNAGSNQSGPVLSLIPVNLPGDGRARTGRVFLPGITETDADPNLISGGLGGALTTFATAQMLPLSLIGGLTATWKLACKVGGSPVLRDILLVIARAYIASQRRRRPRV